MFFQNLYPLPHTCIMLHDNPSSRGDILSNKSEQLHLRKTKISTYGIIVDFPFPFNRPIKLFYSLILCLPGELGSLIPEINTEFAPVILNVKIIELN